MSNEPDPYEILQVRTDAGEDVIRAAYRALARRYHPDAAVDGASSPQMVIVNWAWEILGNPDRRAGYDREHGITPHPRPTVQDVHPPATWSAPSKGGGPAGASGAAGTAGAAGAAGAGDAAGAAGAASGGNGTATGGNRGSGGGAATGGSVPGPGPGHPGSGARPGFGAGRPPVQRRGADGRVIEWRNAPDGTGAAGEPPGPPSGSVLPFGRFIAWSIGEIARYDPGYLDWLDIRPEGEPYRAEIDAALRLRGWRQGTMSRDEPRGWRR